MLSYTFINSHSQVSDPGPKCPLVSKSNLSKISFRNTIRVSNNFDPDQILVQTFCEGYQQMALVGKESSNQDLTI